MRSGREEKEGERDLIYCERAVIQMSNTHTTYRTTFASRCNKREDPSKERGMEGCEQEAGDADEIAFGAKRESVLPPVTLPLTRLPALQGRMT